MADARAVEAALAAVRMSDPYWSRLGAVALIGDATSGFSGVLPGDGSPAHVLLSALDDHSSPTRAVVAQALARLGPAAAEAAPALVARLERITPTDPMDEIAAEIAALRAIGPVRGVAERVAALLVERAPLYTGRDHGQAQALRAWILATLARIGVPASAHRHLLEALANPDPDLPLACAAAVRAAQTAGSVADYAVPHLLALLSAKTDLVYDPDGFAIPRRHARRPGAAAEPVLADAITLRVLAVRALGAIGSAATLPSLDDLARNGIAGAGNSPLIRTEAAAAAAKIRAGAGKGSR
jgi:hypothetical protein